MTRHRTRPSALQMRLAEVPAATENASASASAPPLTLAQAVVTAGVAPPIGVGIDTARYGHHATFLRGDLQAAAPPLNFAESAAGYQQLYERLQHIAGGHRNVHFHIRLDVAGAYADNLIAF